MNRHTLLVKCPDEVGLVAKITTTFFERGLNIVSNWEHVDPDTRRFFMRTEVEGEVDADGLVSQLTPLLPDDAQIRVAEPGRRRIVVLVTKEAHCLGDLLIRCSFGEVNAEIQAVIGNRDTLKDMVEAHGIPFHYIPADDLERDAHEQQVLEVLDRYDPEYLVLAKYMRILNPGFVQRYPNRIINIHHSFLPAFIGANPYRQAYERGVKIVGATAHFVNESLDEGPIIAQNVVPIGHHHSPRDITIAGHKVETITLGRALDLVFDDRVFVCGNKTVVFD